MCEGDLKFELLVFLAAPTAVLGLSFPFLLLEERTRNRLQVKQPTDPQDKGGQPDSATELCGKSAKTGFSDLDEFPSLCLRFIFLKEGSPPEDF